LFYVLVLCSFVSPKQVGWFMKCV